MRQHDFRRNTRRPVCTECDADLTDERWRATERVDRGTAQEPRPSLCQDCDRRYVTDLQQAWPDEHQHEEQIQAVPEQKAGGTWLSRFRK
ncbi:hypothetical protein [Streptomyces sp. NPDC000351]|uniref:hypothetical protein n=1 Tax=Streptomyces sp. NPDC000351 TaxID=3154250 RepID=UPI00332A553C